MYHVDADGGWDQIDGPAFLAELKKGLKTGGIVAIIDHTALAGAAPETGDSLHRIDPDLVVANMEAAGFIFEASSDALNNPDDDLTKMVFAEDIRGNTSRFVMRFRNPD
jgi:predicted methyltransferase